MSYLSFAKACAITTGPPTCPLHVSTFTSFDHGHQSAAAGSVLPHQRLCGSPIALCELCAGDSQSCRVSLRPAAAVASRSLRKVLYTSTAATYLELTVTGDKNSEPAPSSVRVLFTQVPAPGGS